MPTKVRDTSSNAPKTKDIAYFTQVLAGDKEIIDTDIGAYIKHLGLTTQEQFGEGSALAMQAFCDILSRGGKRLRGALVIEGYRMCGGTNQAMILQAARAMEMIHAYLLMIDDMQDRSALRRGGPTAQVALGESFEDEHIGASLATNAALLGNHAAMMILANLDAPAELRSNVISILNRTLLITVHGQVADLLGYQLSEADVHDVQEWKTANYTILNPLHMGMVLAGAGCEVTDAITPYAKATGQAFQIVDDIIGSFGDQAITGKNLMDDIREGKHTLLTIYALQHAKGADRTFLKKCLGNRQLTSANFTRCQAIIRRTGALDHARVEAENYVTKALKSLAAHKDLWSSEGSEFLRGFAEYLLTRRT